MTEPNNAITRVTLKKEDQVPLNQNNRLYRQTNLKVIFGITLMAVMGVASITPAFPKIVVALGISKQQTGLLITVFTLPGIFLTPVLGILADRFGRKKILVPALVVFGISGSVCAFARDFDTILILRFIQGAGAASLGSLNTTLIGDIFPAQQLPQAMGYNSSVLSMGTAIYPAIGGFLATFGWYYPFLLPLLALPVALLVIFKLENPEPESHQSMKNYLKSTWKIFQNSRVIALYSVMLLTFILVYGPILNYYPFFMQKRFGSPPLIIGLVLSAMSLGSGLTSANLGKITREFKKKQLLVSACLLYLTAMVTLPFVSNIWIMLVPTILFGVANGLNIPTIQGLLAGISPIQYRAAFMSANGMSLRLGQTLGPIIMMGVVFVSGSINSVFWVSAGFAFIMLLITLALSTAQPG